MNMNIVSCALFLSNDKRLRSSLLQASVFIVTLTYWLVARPTVLHNDMLIPCLGGR